MESKANAAVSRAQRAKESAKLYRTKLYNVNRQVAQATNIVARCKQESTDLSESIDIVEYLTHIITWKGRAAPAGPGLCGGYLNVTVLPARLET